MKTKQDFQEAIAAAISAYPTAAQLYQARDPRLLAKLDSMATMLALFSAEQDVAAMEPFVKARDMTVLADAAVKGILPFGRPSRIKIAVQNTLTHTLSITAGRRLLDTQGRIYVVDQGATILGNQSGEITAIQKSEVSFQHTVALSKPFYTIDVPQPAAGRHIAEVRVELGAQPFKFVQDFVNVAVGDKSFHLETNENRTMRIVFGAAGMSGYQPAAGEVFTVTVVETEGAFDLDAGAPLTFQYSVSPYEAGARMTHSAVLTPGASPLDIATLRELSRYPSIYDTSAVFLGNFDFLIRRHLSPFKFLSVWNEQVEEEARGPDVDNINTLFVAAEADGVAQATLESKIAAIIKEADDSYKIRFVSVVHSPIPVSVSAKVPAIYDFAVVEQQIRDVINAEYGPASEFAKTGRGRVFYKRLYSILTSSIDALQLQGSDLEIEITDPVGGIMPEHYRYISADSLTVDVQQSDF